MARKEGLSRTTVARKLKFLGLRALQELEHLNTQRAKVSCFQFDDQETAEQSKYRPLAISLAVVERSRWILGFEISSMPVKWKLSPAKAKKYAHRPDERAAGRKRLFERIKPYCKENVVIRSDEHPHYPKDIQIYFPHAQHVRYPSRKPRDHGQDELKRGWDPLFSLNHTCAMHRDRVSRLARKSWCLSKKRENLRLHLAIYVVAHNRRVLEMEKRA